MSPQELDSFLAEERTCRVASVGPSGPHVTPLWFVWATGAIWLYSLTRSQRWIDILRTPRIAIVIDSGHGYAELRGVEFSGDAEVVGEAPRTGAPADPRLDEPERLFARKYTDTDEMTHDGRHGWLRIEPVSTRSWDFRKLG
jgi:hypothetical protein